MSGGLRWDVRLLQKRLNSEISPYKIFSSGIEYPSPPSYNFETWDEISDISFAGESSSITYSSPFIHGSGWQDLSIKSNTFWRVYPSGEYFPDAFPSGLSREHLVYSSQKTVFNSQDIYHKKIFKVAKG